MIGAFALPTGNPCLRLSFPRRDLDPDLTHEYSILTMRLQRGATKREFDSVAQWGGFCPSRREVSHGYLSILHYRGIGKN